MIEAEFNSSKGMESSTSAGWERGGRGNDLVDLVFNGGKNSAEAEIKLCKFIE
jgi:hypothetical protein